MDQLNSALATVGMVVLLLGLLSRPLDRSVFSAPLIAFAAGILLGPAGFDLLRPDEWGDSHKILEEAARLTLGVSLMGIALRLPPKYLADHWRSLAVLLGVVMPLMFVVSSLVSFFVLGLPLLIAMLIGGAICPTDPVVASSVVTGGLAGEKLPARFRHTLSAESGANDGLAYPLVLLPVLLFTEPAGDAWSHWFIKVLAWEVGGALACGWAIGWGGGKALLWAEKRKTIDQPSFLATTLAITVLALGVGNLLGTDSILAVFVAGIAFDQLIGGAERAQEDNIQEAVNLFFTLPIFILFGLMLPVDQWIELGWSGIALVVSVLLLRRLPAVLLLRFYIPDWRHRHLARLGGWFGPIGVSALYYAMLILDRTGQDMVWTVASLLTASSLLAHGMSAAPGARYYWRHRSGDT